MNEALKARQANMDSVNRLYTELAAEAQAGSRQLQGGAKGEGGETQQGLGEDLLPGGSPQAPIWRGAGEESCYTAEE